jgi:hypothetical protein
MLRPFDHQASNTVRVNTASAPPPLRAAPEQGARNGDGGGSVRISELEGVLHQTRLRWIEHQETGRIFAAVSLGRVRRPCSCTLLGSTSPRFCSHTDRAFRYHHSDPGSKG